MWKTASLALEFLRSRMIMFSNALVWVCHRSEISYIMVRLLEVRGLSSNPAQAADGRKISHGFPVIRTEYSALSDWLRTVWVHLQKVDEWQRVHFVDMKFATATADVGDHRWYGAGPNGYL